MLADLKTTWRRRSVLAAAIAVVGLAGATHAFADTDPVDLKVVDRATGRPLPVWRHDGHLYVAGQPGARYSLRVTNHTDGRVLVVMSVDGVNILTGETANYDQDGYVFSPYQSYDVTGWRKSNTQVAAFTFAPLSSSYAARTGRPADVGVIGIAVFNEQAAPPPPPDDYAPVESKSDQPDAHGAPYENPDFEADATRAAPVIAPRLAAPRAAPPPPPAAGMASSEVVAQAERRDEKLGTGHGAREWSETVEVPFERATSYPQFVKQIEYDTYQHLVDNGIIPNWRPWEHQPQPFPNAQDQGFVPDPPRD